MNNLLLLQNSYSPQTKQHTFLEISQHSIFFLPTC